MNNKIVFWILLTISFVSCKKYLDKKPDTTLDTLNSPESLQAFLDDNNTMNLRYPYLSEIMSDNHYLGSDIWNSLPLLEKELYIWKPVDVGTDASVWPYRPIFHANSVLQELEKVDFSNAEGLMKNNIKGSALFFRAFYHFATVQLYAKPYDESTSATDQGIPLRLTADHQERSTRSSVSETYKQIITDLREASILLPDRPLIKTRPSKPASLCTLSKVFLLMKDYDSAAYYADECLKIYDDLLDYNVDIDPIDRAPIKRFNKEIIFFAKSLRATSLIPVLNTMDSNLIKLYKTGDIRMQAFFRNNGDNTYSFKGDYDGLGTSGGILFAGIVTDEIYLIRAECNARLGRIDQALEDLNTLLTNRFTYGEFEPISTTDQNALVDIILEERRKELLFRGTRWADLRRLGNEQGHSTILKREIDNTTFELTTNSPRYTVRFPYEVIAMSGMQQNP